MFTLITIKSSQISIVMGGAAIMYISSKRAMLAMVTETYLNILFYYLIL